MRPLALVSRYSRPITLWISELPEGVLSNRSLCPAKWSRTFNY
jgi:hypothetical protein